MNLLNYILKAVLGIIVVLIGSCTILGGLIGSGSPDHSPEAGLTGTFLFGLIGALFIIGGIRLVKPGKPKNVLEKETNSENNNRNKRFPQGTRE